MCVCVPSFTRIYNMFNAKDIECALCACSQCFHYKGSSPVYTIYIFGHDDARWHMEIGLPC